MLSNLFTLQNPWMAPVMIMVACFLIGGVVAAVAFLLARKSYVGKRVRDYAKAETARLHAQLDACLEANLDLKDSNLMYKQKISAMTLFITKALTEAKLDVI